MADYETKVIRASDYELRSQGNKPLRDRLDRLPTRPTGPSAANPPSEPQAPQQKPEK